MVDGLNILYFSDQWDNKWRRRQQIAFRISRIGIVKRLIYVELPLTLTSFVKYIIGKADSESTQRWGRVIKKGFSYDFENITIITPFSLLPFFNTKALSSLNLLFVKKSIIGRIPKEFIPDIYWASLPFDALWLKNFKGYDLIYDCSEEFSEFGNWQNIRHYIKKWDNELTKVAQRIFVQTEYLKSIKSKINGNITVIPNAVDENVFSSIDASVESVNLNNIPKPILGYIGSINYRLDVELIKGIAVERPNWSIVMVGNNCLNIQNGWPTNVHFLPEIDYRRVPGMIALFDVCLLPHLANNLVDSESPIKLFDYMASGKPIVSQNIAGVRPYGEYVYLAEDKSQFIAAIEKALKEKSNMQAKRKEYGLTQNWDNRVNEIKNYL